MSPRTQPLPEAVQARKLSPASTFVSPVRPAVDFRPPELYSSKFALSYAAECVIICHTQNRK